MRKKKFGSVIVIILFLLIMLVSVNINSEEMDINKVKYLETLTVVAFGLILFTNPYPLLSAYTFLMGFVFLYNCGQLWIHLFGFEIVKNSYAITRFSNSELANACLYLILFVMLTHLFVVINSGEHKKVLRLGNISLMSIDNSDQTIMRYKKYLYIILLISVPLLLYYDISQIITANTYGYVTALYSRRSSTLLSIVDALFSLIIYGLFLCETSKWKRNSVAIYGLLRYSLMMVLVGYRMQAMAFAVGLFMIWSKQNEEKRNRYLIWIAPLAIGLLVLASWISGARHGIVNDNSVPEMIRSSMQEIGGTFIDIPIVMSNIDSIGYAYGKTYYFGLLNMIPFMLRLFPSMNQYFNLSAVLNNYWTIYSGSSLGGNIIAEMFFNFGWLALVFTPIVAKIVANICDKIESDDNTIAATLSMYMFFILALYIRGNMGEIMIYLRNYLYLYLLLGFFLPKKEFE